VSHLRLLPGQALQVRADEACLDAFQREIDYVYRSLRRLGTPPADVDDLAQDVFLALRRSWAEFDATRPLRAYLFGIMFRLNSAHRRRWRREVAFGLVEPGDPSPGPDDVLQSKQARRVVLAALDRIPLPRRAVLVMHDLDDVSMNDIAGVLKIPLFTGYSRLRKARRELEAAVRRILKEGEAR